MSKMINTQFLTSNLIDQIKISEQNRDVLGHAKASITLDIYGHLIPTMQTEVAEMIDDLARRGCSRSIPEA